MLRDASCCWFRAFWKPTFLVAVISVKWWLVPFWWFRIPCSKGEHIAAGTPEYIRVRYTWYGTFILCLGYSLTRHICRYAGYFGKYQKSPRRAGKPVHSQNGLNEFENCPFLNHALFEKCTTNSSLILNVLYSACAFKHFFNIFKYCCLRQQDMWHQSATKNTFQIKRIQFRRLIKQIVCDSFTIMDNNSNEEREPPVLLTPPPPRIELVVGADSTGMACANLLHKNYDLEENLDDDQYMLLDKIVHYVGGQIRLCWYLRQDAKYRPCTRWQRLVCNLSVWRNM